MCKVLYKQYSGSATLASPEIAHKIPRTRVNAASPRDYNPLRGPHAICISDHHPDALRHSSEVAGSARPFSECIRTLYLIAGAAISVAPSDGLRLRHLATVSATASSLRP